MSDRTLERTRAPFRRLAACAGILDAGVTVLARPLTPEEAIGTPGRRDFPILVGRERVIEARMGESAGHAFTDTAREFAGSLATAVDLPFRDNGDRAIYLAALNAALRHLGLITGTVHCRDDDPEACGAEIATALASRFGATCTVGLVGLNPAILEHLVGRFGAERVLVTDRNPETLGPRRFGVEVWDGAKRTDDLVGASDVVLLTGTTLVNGTYDAIRDRLEAAGKPGIVYGVTVAGVAHLLDLDRLCPRAR